MDGIGGRIRASHQPAADHSGRRHSRRNFLRIWRPTDAIYAGARHARGVGEQKRPRRPGRLPPGKEHPKHRWLAHAFGGGILKSRVPWPCTHGHARPRPGCRWSMLANTQAWHPKHRLNPAVHLVRKKKAAALTAARIQVPRPAYRSRIVFKKVSGVE